MTSDRLPPQNLEAEAGVIGSILLDNRVIPDVILCCGADDFYRDAHRLMFEAMIAVFEAGKPVDAVTLCAELERRDDLKRAGGEDYVSECLAGVPHAAHAKYYAQIVRQKAVTRGLVESAHETLTECYSNNFTAEQLLESSERRVFAIARDNVQGTTAKVGPVMGEVVERLGRKAAGEITTAGLPTGLLDLDDLLGGLEPESLVIVAARPSMGKTAFALNVAEYVSLDMGEPTLLVSLEMGRHPITERWLVSRSRVDGHKVKSGRNLSTREMHAINEAHREFVTANIHIDDTPARSMLQIAANARRIKAQDGLSLMIVDYIQLVEPDEPRDNRQEQVAKISRRLKTLAREIKVPVIALSQLNRGVENREDKRPRLADLRESGAIEQDADQVILLHRPDYYDANDKPGAAELIVAKNRNGATGTVQAVFHRHIQRFGNENPVDSPAIVPFDQPF